MESGYVLGLKNAAAYLHYPSARTHTDYVLNVVADRKTLRRTNVTNHPHTDACEACGDPVFDNCHYCGDACCSEHALTLPGYTLLRACPDCLGLPAISRQLSAEVA